MEQKTLRVLEYTKIIEKLAGKATSDMGKARCLELKPETVVEAVESALKRTSEAVGLMIQHGNPPIGPIYDIESSVKRAEIGAALSPKQLMQVGDTLRTGRVLKRFVGMGEAKREAYPSLSALSDGIITHEALEKHIETCILSETEISDHASPELARIRKNIESKNAAIRAKLESMVNSPEIQKYLQDSLITIRQDRFVLPVKSEHKNHIKGLVHDQSAKGSTFYIEPIAVVEMNNALRELRIEEQREIERILHMLSAEVAEVAGSILVMMTALIELDFIFAKGKLSLEMKAVEPALRKDYAFRIKNGRHPLIDPSVVVPSNIWMGEHFTTLLITGPNTGGKTVTLKTVGLLTLMAQAGLHIPADYGTSIAVFDRIFADIGDEQSIEQSLSTFSSHMTNIVEILKKVNAGSLVLFDELGAGTDPTEGAALAMAILDKLRLGGIRTMATTHYSELKAYAIATEGIENASVEFNVETLSPTYRLLIGIPGKSNAFEISRKLGLENGLIDAAKAYVHQDNIAFEDVVASIEKSRKIAEQERDEAIRMRLEVEKLRNALKDKEDKWLTQRDDLMRKAKEESRQLLKQTKAESDEIVKRLREMKKHVDEADNRDIEKMRRKLQEGLDRVSDSGIQTDVENAFAPETLQVGDTVRVLTINQEGTVLTPPNDKGEVVVQVGLMKMTTELKQVVQISKHKADRKIYEKVKASRSVAADIRPEIDVRGLRLDEAIMEIDKYIDDALIANLQTVRIIHGKGTGVLQKGLHDYFRGHSHVKHYEFAAYNEGGSGATIVTLK
ncbi:MAG: mismatch repair protein MutS2 [Clostridiales bacterium]|nr:mismatch repair protein MutS2 [Clostridiales bacterium]